MDIDLEDLTEIPSGVSAKHVPVMALTRAMSAKLAAQLSTEDTPVKNSKLHVTSPSPRKLPTPRPSSSSRMYYCQGCQKSRTSSDSVSSTVLSNYSEFNFQDFATRVFAQFNELNTKIELIGNRISDINESISDHHAIINELEREISLIANKLSSLDNKSSVPVPSSAESNLNYIPSSPRHTYTSFPPFDSPALSRHHPTPSRAPPHPSRPHPPPSELHPPPPELILPLPDLILPLLNLILPPPDLVLSPHDLILPPPALLLPLPVLILASPVLTFHSPDLFNLCPALIHPVLILPCPVLNHPHPVLFILLSVPIIPHPVLVLLRGVIIPLHLMHIYPRDVILLRLVPIHHALLALSPITVIVNLSIRLLHLIHSLLVLSHLYLVLLLHIMSHPLFPIVSLRQLVRRCWCWVIAIRNI